MSMLKPELNKKVPFQVNRRSSIATSGLPSSPAGRWGVPLSVPLPFLLTSAGAVALFGLLLPALVPEAGPSPEGERVEVIIREEAETKTALLCVCDHGIGIPVRQQS